MVFKFVVTNEWKYKSIKNFPGFIIFSMGKSSATNLRSSAFICG